MKKILLVGTGMVAFMTSGAVAADMPPIRKAPQAPVAVSHNWSGIYIGGNVGYGWGKANTSASLPASDTPGLLGDLRDGLLDVLDIVDDIGVDVLFNQGFPALTGSTAFSASNDLRGIIGGGQIGFNVQSGVFVFGFEADFQGADQNNKASRSDPFNLAFRGEVNLERFGIIARFVGDYTGNTSTSYRTSIDWFGTVRGRIGVAADNVLFYGTGGLAYGRVQLSGSMSTSGNLTGSAFSGEDIAFDVDFGSDSAFFRKSKVNCGWTVGGGIEWAVTENLSIKAEYLYMDLGEIDIAGTTQLGLDYSMRAEVTNQIARVGFNYRFGGAPF